VSEPIKGNYFKQALFVVLRIDEFSSAELIEDKVAAVSIFRDEEQARAEAERLRGLRSADQSRYVVIPSRLKGR